MPSRKRKRMVIRDPSVLRALKSPVRQEIVDVLDRSGALSVRELAEELGRKAASLYYHVHDLALAGVIVEVGTRPSGKRTEAVYDLAAEKVLIDRGARSPEFLKELSALHRSALRRAERELAAAVAEPSAGGDPEKSATLLRMSARLRPDKAAVARRKMMELTRYLSDNSDAEAPDAYALTVAFVRVNAGRG